MDTLSVAFGKIILATLSIPIPEDPIDIIALAKNQTFFVRKTVNRREKVIIHGDDVAAIFDLLYKLDTEVEEPAAPTIPTYGDVVQATYNGEPKEGAIKGIFYEVEGCGKKHHALEDVTKVAK